MADKSFEEQVRDELTGFTLEPDAGVWDNVGKALQGDKKRRWAIWFFLFAIAGSAAAYWLYETNSGSGIAPVSNIASAVKPGEKPTGQTINPANAEQPVNSNLPRGSFLTVQKENDRITITKAKGKRSTILLVRQNITAARDGNTNNDPVSSVSSVKTDERQETPSVKVHNGSEPDTTAIASVETEKQLPVNSGDSSVGRNGDAKFITPIMDSSVMAAPNTAEHPLVATKKKTPWKFGIAVDLGRSELVSFSRALYASSTAAFAVPPNNNYLNSGVSTPGFYYTSAARPGYSFGISGEATRELIKKWMVTASLGYSLYTTKLNVGNKVDSAVGNGGYYIAANDRTYINGHHFLQAGVAFYRNFSIGSSFSFRWNVGLGLNWLFLGNALQLDPARRILYVDNSSVHKLQANLSTGLDLGIGKRPLVYIGPDLNFFISKYDQSNTLYNNRRFFTFGIKTHLLLSKR